MKGRAAAVAALVAMSGWSPASAGPAVDAAMRAESLQANGKPIEAIDALNEALDAVWSEMPLSFRNVTIVSAPPRQGIVRKRDDATFKPDEKLMVHIEPVGYGYGRLGGVTRIGFTADLAIENSTGQVLAETRNIFSLSRPSTPKGREFSMTVSFAVPYLRPGEHKAVFTIRDQNSSKTGTIEIPFAIALPTAD